MKFYGQCAIEGGASIDQIIYDRYFTNYPKGVAIECGATDGLENSTCKFFEESLGWKVINIEGSLINYMQLVKNRPNSTNLFNILTEIDNEVTQFYHYVGAEGLGCVQNYGVKEWLHDKTPISNPCVTVRYDTLIKEPIDLFVIDVEGHEFHVLEGMRNSQFMPKIICIEHMHVGIDPIVEKLKNLYTLDHIDYLNACFVRIEK